MDSTTDLGKIETQCKEIMNSAYFRKPTPVELVQLRIVLDRISMLVTGSVPPLIAEVKQLRNKNKRLKAEIEALDLRNQPQQESLPT